MELILAIALSHHIGMEGDYNEIHPHVQLQLDSGFVAGAFLNSESNVSPYLGWRFEYDAAFMELGAVAGYAAITVAPYVRVGYEIKQGVDLFLAPVMEFNDDDEVNVGAVIGLSVRM